MLARVSPLVGWVVVRPMRLHRRAHLAMAAEAARSRILLLGMSNGLPIIASYCSGGSPPYYGLDDTSAATRQGSYSPRCHAAQPAPRPAPSAVGAGDDGLWWYDYITLTLFDFIIRCMSRLRRPVIVTAT